MGRMTIRVRGIPLGWLGPSTASAAQDGDQNGNSVRCPIWRNHINPFYFKSLSKEKNWARTKWKN